MIEILGLSPAKFKLGVGRCYISLQYRSCRTYLASHAVYSAFSAGNIGSLEYMAVVFVKRLKYN
jgi:hypothetical protein